ncbi:MAG: Holliday junction branch migration DNA helicase RuvB, partial [Mycoplasmataceae bacterium]|nr:Holliday junction branch migration DNA helicase RuvB [Mycoplasmataceae bacterium]
ITIEEIFKKIKIGSNGLTSDDFEYLKVLKHSKKPIGLITLSHLLNIDHETIENKIEPYLLNNYYITKTNVGREITSKGLEINEVKNS